MIVFYLVSFHSIKLHSSLVEINEAKWKIIIFLRHTRKTFFAFVIDFEDKFFAPLDIFSISWQALLRSTLKLNEEKNNQTICFIIPALDGTILDLRSAWPI